jgi:hypothetical protein
LRKTRMPLYPAENVSARVVQHVLQGRSGKLFMPESGYYLSFMKALPNWCFDLLAGHVKQGHRGK